MSTSFVWWLKFAAAILFPFAFAVTVNELGHIYPGTIKLNHWRAASSIASLATIIPVLVLLYKARFSIPSRVVLGVLAVPFLLFVAFTFQLRSMCGPQPEYVGVKAKAELVASCN